MRWTMALVLAAGLAGVAAADDRAAQFEAARAAFLAWGDGRDPEPALTHLLAGIDGDWTPASHRMPDEPVDADWVAERCERPDVRLLRTGPLTFEMQHSPPGQVVRRWVETYAAVGATRFVVTMTEADFMVFAGSEHAAKVFLPFRGSFATLHRPSPDVLVTVPEGDMPRIWLRC